MDPQGHETTDATITVVGLGPGDLSLLTLGALEQLQQARVVFFRTLVHPTVEPLRARLGPGPRLASFDAEYERAESFAALYGDIAAALIAAACSGEGPIIYAVPGHPLVGEQSVTQLLKEAPQRQVTVRIVEGLSFLEPLFTALSLDPLEAALQVMDGGALLSFEPVQTGPVDQARWQGISPRVVATDRPLVLGQVYNRRVATSCKLWLLERYPPTHQITVVTAAGAVDTRLRTVALAELDHSAVFDHLTSLYIPPLDPLRDPRGLATLPFIAARLRALDGCPWDREQTWASLKPHVLEEAFEAVAALDSGDAVEVAEELGDLMLLVTMLAAIGDETGVLDLPQVLETVNSKLIRRHPHVFGTVTATSSTDVIQHWERIKADERGETRSLLDGVPVAMPALIASQVMQRKAAAAGFDWPDAAAVTAKVQEEWQEVQAAAAGDHLEEVGDLLFALVSLCRHLSIDAEEALRAANAKFRRRLAAVETLARRQGTALTALDPLTLDDLWEQVKAAERA